MGRVMGLASVTNKDSWDKLSRCSGKTVERSWDSEGAIGIERFVVLCCNAINDGVPRGMAYENLLIIHEILSHALVGPIVDELLELDIFRPIIRIRHQDRHLNMVN